MNQLSFLIIMDIEGIEKYRNERFYTFTQHPLSINLTLNTFLSYLYVPYRDFNRFNQLML
jgi:lipopolysaccharide assembly outer membrane protein LptD (OstA)